MPKKRIPGKYLFDIKHLYTQYGEFAISPFIFINFISCKVGLRVEGQQYYLVKLVRKVLNAAR